MRPSARRGPAGAAPLATGTSSASSSTRFINSSKPIMRPSIRKLDCSYSHTAMRVRWQERGRRDAGQGRGGWRRKRAGGEKQEDKGRRRHAIDMLRTVCKKRKMTVSGCVIALETRGAPDISEGRRVGREKRGPRHTHGFNAPREREALRPCPARTLELAVRLRRCGGFSCEWLCVRVFCVVFIYLKARPKSCAVGARAPPAPDDACQRRELLAARRATPGVQSQEVSRRRPLGRLRIKNRVPRATRSVRSSESLSPPACGSRDSCRADEAVSAGVQLPVCDYSVGPASSPHLSPQGPGRGRLRRQSVSSPSTTDGSASHLPPPRWAHPSAVRLLFCTEDEKLLFKSEPLPRPPHAKLE